MTKPHIRIVPLEVYRRSLAVLVGDFDELGKALRNHKLASLTPDEAKILRRQWGGIEKGVAACREDEIVPLSGCCFVVNGDIYIYMPEWSSMTLVHELYHAARRLAQILGTDDEEVGAYFVEFAFQELAWEKGKRQ